MPLERLRKMRLVLEAGKGWGEDHREALLRTRPR